MDDIDPLHDTLRHESELRTLIAAYCHHYDDRRPEAFAELFTEDAEFTVFGRTISGRDAIRDQIGTQAPDQPPGQHVTYNSVLEVDTVGGTANGATDFCYLAMGPDGLSIARAGRYHDRFVYQDRWRISRRTIVFLGESVPDDRTPSDS